MKIQRNSPPLHISNYQLSQLVKDTNSTIRIIQLKIIYNSQAFHQIREQINTWPVYTRSLFIHCTSGQSPRSLTSFKPEVGVWWRLTYMTFRMMYACKFPTNSNLTSITQCCYRMESYDTVFFSCELIIMYLHFEQNILHTVALMQKKKKKNNPTFSDPIVFFIMTFLFSWIWPSKQIANHWSIKHRTQKDQQIWVAKSHTGLIL